MQEEPVNEANTNPVKLTDITRGLYHAASSTYSMVANQYINLITQYFDEAAEGVYVPKTVEVQLPDESIMSIPLVSLVAPKGLMLDQVDFDFAVTADASQLAQATTELNKLDELTRSSFRVEMAAPSRDTKNKDSRSRNGVIDISMKFKAVDPPEALMRIFDKFSSLVTPLKPVYIQNTLIRISPQLIKIAEELERNESNYQILSAFNDDFTHDALKKRSEEVIQIEKELEVKSLVIAQESEKAREQFKKTREYARIVFEGSVAYDKLMLSIKISTTVRQWLAQAEKFYNILLDDENLVEKLQKLEKPDVLLSAESVPRLQQEYNLVKNLGVKLQEYDILKNQLKKEEEWLKKFMAIARMLFKHQPELLAALFPELPDY